MRTKQKKNVGAGMSDILWQKLFEMARNLGDSRDLEVLEVLTGKGPRKKYKSKKKIVDIQERWNARRQKRTLSRIVSSESVSNQSISKVTEKNVSKKI